VDHSVRTARGRIRALCILAALCGTLLSTSLLAAPASAAGTPDEFVRGVYGRDASASKLDVIRSTGFNAVDVMPFESELDGLAARGLKGMVSLYMYRNETCTFDKDDAWVRQTVSALKDHPAVLAWQITDEPNAYRCPNAPAQIRARHQLIKSVDPSHDTYVTVAIWDGRSLFPFEDFAGTTDVMGLVVYPCGGGKDAGAPCHFEYIDQAIAQAARDGVSRYWAVVQDFEDEYGHRVPTTSELTRQFDEWTGAPGLEGYFLFHWEWGQVDQRPAHLEALKHVNATWPPAPSGAPAPAPAPQPAPTAALPRAGEPAPAAVAAPRGLAWRQDGRSVVLTWEAAGDGVSHYEVRLQDGRTGRTEGTSFRDEDPLRFGATYSVVSVAPSGAESDPARVYVPALVGKAGQRHLTLCWTRAALVGCRRWARLI
jgi:hypothetical protein